MPPWVTVIGRSSRDVGGQPLLERRRCTLTIQHKRRPCRHAGWIPPLWDATHDRLLAEGCRVAAFRHRKRAPARTGEAAPNSMGPACEMSASRRRVARGAMGGEGCASTLYLCDVVCFACQAKQTIPLFALLFSDRSGACPPVAVQISNNRYARGT